MIAFIRLCWISWLLLWIALSLRTKATARREPAASRARHTAPVVIGALLMVQRTGWPVLDSAMLPRLALFAPAAAALVLAGLAFAIWARLTIAGNWSGTVTLKRGHELVRKGPYGIVRHPIYSGLLLAMLGNVLAIDAWRALAGFALVLVGFVQKIGIEEQFMQEAFGADYTAYSTKVGSLLPRL